MASEEESEGADDESDSGSEEVRPAPMPRGRKIMQHQYTFNYSSLDDVAMDQSYASACVVSSPTWNVISNATTQSPTHPPPRTRSF